MEMHWFAEKFNGKTLNHLAKKSRNNVDSHIRSLETGQKELLNSNNLRTSIISFSRVKPRASYPITQVLKTLLPFMPRAVLKIQSSYNRRVNRTRDQKIMADTVRSSLKFGGMRHKSRISTSVEQDMANLNAGTLGKRMATCVFFHLSNVETAYYPKLMKQLIHVGATKQTLDFLTKSPEYMDEMFVKYFKEGL